MVSPTIARTKDGDHKRLLEAFSPINHGVGQEQYKARSKMPGCIGEGDIPRSYGPDFEQRRTRYIRGVKHRYLVVLGVMSWML